MKSGQKDDGTEGVVQFSLQRVILRQDAYSVRARYPVHRLAGCSARRRDVETFWPFARLRAVTTAARRCQSVVWRHVSTTGWMWWLVI